jgi:hypothetical protein
MNHTSLFMGQLYCGEQYNNILCSAGRDWRDPSAHFVGGCLAKQSKNIQQL